MAEVLPFVGLRYNSQQIGNLGKVVSPSFDEITPELQAELHARHEFNIVRLELGLESDEEDSVSDRYSRATTLLRAWCSDGVLVEDQAPALYVIDQEFTYQGTKCRRRGVLAVVKLNEGTVRGHERTFEGPKEDRLHLLRATKANISPIFAVFEDPDGKVIGTLEPHAKGKAWESATDHSGMVHKMWVVQKREAIMAFREAVKDLSLTIADGHHRFETALQYRDEMRRKTGKADGNQPFDYVMMYLSGSGPEGLVVQPIHRLFTRQMMAEVDLPQALEELEQYFQVRESKVDLGQPAAAAETLNRELAGAGRTRYVLVQPSGRYWTLDLMEDVRPEDLVDDEVMDDQVKRLDTSLLHHFIVSHVMVGNPEYELEEDDCSYVQDPVRLLTLLKDKKSGLAVLMNPPSMADVIGLAGQGLRMPQKSTHFFPKPACGLVLRSMESDERLKGKK
jgi:uncharacterized protein (DUF1015 family)